MTQKKFNFWRSAYLRGFCIRLTGLAKHVHIISFFTYYVSIRSFLHQFTDPFIILYGTHCQKSERRKDYMNHYENNYYQNPQPGQRRFYPSGQTAQSSYRPSCPYPTPCPPSCSSPCPPSCPSPCPPPCPPPSTDVQMFRKSGRYHHWCAGESCQCNECGNRSGRGFGIRDSTGKRRSAGTCRAAGDKGRNRCCRSHRSHRCYGSSRCVRYDYHTQHDNG